MDTQTQKQQELVKAMTPTSEEAFELIVSNAEVKVKDDPRTAAEAIVSLSRQVEELLAQVRVPALRLAKQDELRGRQSVAWVNPKGNFMALRLMFEGLVMPQGKTKIECSVLRRDDGTFRANYLRNDYKRGLLEGKHRALNTKATSEEYRNTSELVVTGDLANAVGSFLDPANLKAALEADGHTDQVARFFNGGQQPATGSTQAPPPPARPRFEG